MKNTRRDIFKFAGGAAAGVLFTPAPWRLITDTALWSENWPGIPRPARGEIRAKFTNCALCPAGCAVRARCVGEQPVSLAGVCGGLCPFGLTAHHLGIVDSRLGAKLVQNILPRLHRGLLAVREARFFESTHRRGLVAFTLGGWAHAARGMAPW